MGIYNRSLLFPLFTETEGNSDIRQDKTVVSIIKPTVAMKMIANVELAQIAATIEKKLKRVFDAIGEIDKEEFDRKKKDLEL